MSTSILNQVCAKLVTNLKQIGVDGTRTWYTAPKTVRRGIAVDAMSLPKPALFVMSSGWKEDVILDMTSGYQSGRAAATITVLCICDQPPTSDKAEAALNDLAADVVRVVKDDYQLGGLIPTGYLKVEGWTPEVELSGNTFSVASVEVAALWSYDTRAV